MEKVLYKKGTFVDYKGVTRDYVMAAVSFYTKDVEVFIGSYGCDADSKVLSLGVAVCRPGDEFDAEIGKAIAKGKATKCFNHTLAVTDDGLINGKMVEALLEQESKYFESNPGRYLLGYDKAADKYCNRVRVENFIDNLKGDAKVAFNYLVSIADDAKALNRIIEAIAYVTKC